MNLITTLTAYPSWGTRCTRKIHRPLQMSRLALLIATALVNSPSYADDFYFTLNEDDPSSTIADLTNYFGQPIGVFESSNNNSNLLQVSLSGNCAAIFTLFIPYWCGKDVTVTLLPNQNGDAIIDTSANPLALTASSQTHVYLHIHVNPVNDAPVANNVSLTTNEDTPLNSNLPATDIDGPSLTYSLVSNGSQGTAIITNTSTGAFTYTPKPDVNGTDSFTFKANDGFLDSDTVKPNDGFLDSNVATVNVTINPVNDAPILTATNPPTRHDDFGGYMVFKNWATFSPGKPADEANQTLVAYTVSKISNPSLFAVGPAIDNSGTLTYVLADGQSGSSSFEVTVQDNGGTANGGVDTSAQFFTTNVLIAKINVREGGLNLLKKGDTYDFGKVAVGGRQTQAFIIDNLGLYELLLTGSPHPIILLGNQAPNFSVDETNTTNFIGAGNNSTFSLTLTPSQLGTTSATVVIPNTDLRNGSYSFNVTGTGVPAKMLQVSLTGNGTGSVTSDPAGLDCSANHPTCTLPVADAPKWVSLTATPAAGSAFTGWTGDPACMATGQVLILQDISCTAAFTLRSYQLTANFLGKGRVTGPGIDCPGQCTASYLYGTTVTLKAQTTHKWNFSEWRGCDSQGNIQITNDALCQAVFTSDPNIPNAGDGNGDGLPDAYQDNVVSLPDKVTGTYLTLEAQPATCVISDIYPDLPEAQTIKLDHTKKFPQGMLYFDIACPQAQVSVYYHGMSKVYRNLKFYKFGPKIPGDLTTLAWYQLPNVKYELVTIGGKPVVKGTYTLKDGELGDSTGVDGHIVDPGGLVYP